METVFVSPRFISSGLDQGLAISQEVCTCISQIWIFFKLFKLNFQSRGFLVVKGNQCNGKVNFILQNSQTKNQIHLFFTLLLPTFLMLYYKLCFYASATKHLWIGMLVRWSVGQFQHKFQKSSKNYLCAMKQILSPSP